MSITTRQDFELETTVTFNLYSAAYDRVEFTGRVTGIMAADGVPLQVANVQENHFNIYPNLPTDIQSEITDNYRDYYYLVLSSDGEVYYLGLPWINRDTIQVTSTVTATVTISNFTDEPRFRKLLAANGYSLETISLN